MLNKFIFVLVLLNLTACSVLRSDKWEVYYNPHVAFGFSNIDESRLEKIAEYHLYVDDENFGKVLRILNDLNYISDDSGNETPTYLVKLENKKRKQKYLVSFNTVYYKGKKGVMSEDQHKLFYEELNSLPGVDVSKSKFDVD